MTDNLQQTYINYSNEFRRSKGSKESLANLYDLLYHLETIARSPNENRILSNVQSLLGYHKSAYDTFKPTVATDDRKELKKLYKLQDMAKSHGDFFATKDLRKRHYKKRLPLSAADFQQGDAGEHSYLHLKDIVIFNQPTPPR
ncbi:MAG: hypothetical protein HRT65_14335 [Flavobacteriaceae bacterium]|nr:hypothetical protein [Flavobacteriaceae bacterium]